MLLAAVFGALLLAPAAAHAQDRSPAQRQTLIDLAYVMGQSHALRQACAGADDQFWRGRMLGMVQTEAPDADFDTRLRESFNQGFAASQAQFPSCGPDSRAAAVSAAAHGRALAATLAREMADDQAVR